MHARCFWETPNGHGVNDAYVCVWLVVMMMLLTQIITECLCCKCPATAHFASCTLPTQICTRTLGAEIRWANIHCLISASFQLTCSNQCWTFVSIGKRNKSRLEKNTDPTWTCTFKRTYRIRGKALVDKDARKTFADSVSSLFRKLPECPSDADVAAVQNSCSFIHCSDVWMGATRCGEYWWKSNPIVESGERCYSIKSSGLQGMASKQSRTFYSFAVGWGLKVRSFCGIKVQNAMLVEFRT